MKSDNQFPEEDTNLEIAEMLSSEDNKSNLVADIKSKYEKAKSARRSHEDRWIKAYHNYRGQYMKNIRFNEHEKSRLFIKVTKTKVLAAFGQVEDILFGANDFPLSVKETPVPMGITEWVNTGPESEEKGQEMAPPETPNPMDVGYAGDGKKLKKGAKFGDLFEVDVENDREMAVGRDLSGQFTNFKLSKMAAENADKLIKDQLTETNAKFHLRKSIFELCLLGTGIIKGPFTHFRTINKWETDEEGIRAYSPEYVKSPMIEYCSVWNFYPDPNAFSTEDAEYVIQKHVLNRVQLRELAKRPLFSMSAILKVLSKHPNHEDTNFDTTIQTEDHMPSLEGNQWDVFEYWGIVDAEVAKKAGLDVNEEESELQINAWICGDQLLRLVVNPFSPARIPYYVVPYEENPYSIFGVGVAENMEDSQHGMNGHARMAVDNLALAGNLVFDIDETALAPGQDMTIYPGKKFVRNSGAPGQSIYGIKFPNTANENMQMFDRFRQLADESTGIPSYSHGNTGVTGMTRTASGMSMLMGAAALNIKTVVKNLDFYLLEPLGKAFYSWNMQFYDGDLFIDGDLTIQALGTASVMQKEVRSQRLQMFMQMAANPMLAPMVKWETVLKEFAKTLDFDIAEFINSPEEAKAYAEIIGLQNAMGGMPGMAQMQGAPGPGGGLPPGGPAGPTGNGNGNIGTGAAPQPGEPEFSANKA